MSRQELSAFCKSVKALIELGHVDKAAEILDDCIIKEPERGKQRDGVDEVK